MGNPVSGRSALANACCGVAGLCFVVTPWVMLLLSAKSPLRSHDVAYIHGFGLGIGFILFMLVGIWLVVGAIAAHRRRASAQSPPP